MNLQIPKKFYSVEGNDSLCGEVSGRMTLTLSMAGPQPRAVALQQVRCFVSSDCTEGQMCERSCRHHREREQSSCWPWVPQSLKDSKIPVGSSMNVNKDCTDEENKAPVPVDPMVWQRLQGSQRMGRSHDGKGKFCCWPVLPGAGDKKQWPYVMVRVCVCFTFCDCFWDRKRDRSYRGCWDVGS